MSSLDFGSCDLLKTLETELTGIVQLQSSGDLPNLTNGNVKFPQINRHESFCTCPHVNFDFFNNNK